MLVVAKIHRALPVGNTNVEGGEVPAAVASFFRLEVSGVALLQDQAVAAKSRSCVVIVFRLAY